MVDLCNKCGSHVLDINPRTGKSFIRCSNCRNYSKQKNIEWKQRNPDLPAKLAKKRRKTHSKIISKQRKIIREKLKQQIFNAYGHMCNHCGEIRNKLLTIDHVNNDGGKHRKLVGRRSEDIYKDVIKEYRPDKYQILCISCNWHKGMYKELPEFSFCYEDVREG